jgi:hypothetical protein
MALPHATLSAEEGLRRNVHNAGFSSSRRATKSFAAMLRSSSLSASSPACFTNRHRCRRYMPQNLVFA